MIKTAGNIGKLDYVYEGPYTVVRKNKGGAHVLRDEKNEILPREYAPSQLKSVSQDEIIPCDELYEVQAIVAHREVAHGKYEYKVRWKGYTEMTIPGKPKMRLPKDVPLQIIGSA